MSSETLSKAVGESPASGADEEGNAHLRGPGTPRWFEYLTLVACTAVASFGGIGLLLADAGHYSAKVALPLGAVGTALLTFFARPVARPVSRPAGRPAVAARLRAAPGEAWAAGGAVLAGLLVAAWNAHFSARHVAVDRDPGVYLVAGRWLAGHGSLVVPAGAAWPAHGAGLNLASAGTYTTAGGNVQFQFPHLLPVLNAEAHALGGDTLMFAVPAVLGAIAMWALYAVACRVVARPAMALVAVIAFGASLPVLSVTRDDYSESATLVLLWGGVWLLLRAHGERRVLVGLVAGLVLGATLMTRIDAVAYLLPLPVLGAIGWVGAERTTRRQVSLVYAAVGVGVLASAALGTFDVQRRTGQYYLDLRHDVLTLYGGLVVSVVVAVGIVVTAEHWGWLSQRIARRRRSIGVAAAWVAGIGLFLAWAIRPMGPKTMLTGAVAAQIAHIQAAQGIQTPPQTYAEDTMIWISWYIGPIALALGIVGVCVLIHRVMSGRDAPALVFLAMTAPLTAVYLWNPAITPDQIWAMRRFVPVTLPLFLVAAVVAVEHAAALCLNLRGGWVWRRRVLIVGAVAIVVFPLAVTAPVRAFRPQAPYLAVVQATCRFLGPHAAVVFPSGDYDGVTLTQTIRTWCGVPAARLDGPITSAQLAALSAQMRATGRTLWVLGYSPGEIAKGVPGLKPTLVATAPSFHELQETLLRPANSYSEEILTVYAAPA